MKLAKLKILFVSIFIIILINNVFCQIGLASANGNYLSEKQTKEKVSYKSDSVFKNKPNRFVVITEFYTLRDLNSNKNFYFNKSYSGLRMVSGILLNEHLIIGVGAGIDDNGIPVSFDLRYMSYNKNSSPTIGINIAHNTKNNTFTNESLKFNPTIGIRSFIANKSSVILNIGICFYTSQLTTYNYYSSNTGLRSSSKIESIPQQYLTFGGGFIF